MVLFCFEGCPSIPHRGNSLSRKNWHTPQQCAETFGKLLLKPLYRHIVEEGYDTVSRRPRFLKPLPFLDRLHGSPYK